MTFFMSFGGFLINHGALLPVSSFVFSCSLPEHCLTHTVPSLLLRSPLLERKREREKHSFRRPLSARYRAGSAFECSPKRCKTKRGGDARCVCPWSAPLRTKTTSYPLTITQTVLLFFMSLSCVRRLQGARLLTYHSPKLLYQAFMPCAYLPFALLLKSQPFHFQFLKNNTNVNIITERERGRAAACRKIDAATIDEQSYCARTLHKL